MLTPKKHAEWTFFASKATKKKLDVVHDDVGLFIDRGEVLAVGPISVPIYKNDRLVIPISEGRVEIINAEWEEWKRPLEEAESVFDIDRILDEYASE